MQNIYAVRNPNSNKFKLFGNTFDYKERIKRIDNESRYNYEDKFWIVNEDVLKQCNFKILCYCNVEKICHEENPLIFELKYSEIEELKKGNSLSKYYFCGLCDGKSVLKIIEFIGFMER
jgi:hypothetical protein